jgi:hypothetical protein
MEKVNRHPLVILGAMALVFEIISHISEFLEWPEGIQKLILENTTSEGRPLTPAVVEQLHLPPIGLFICVLAFLCAVFGVMSWTYYRGGRQQRAEMARMAASSEKAVNELKDANQQEMARMAVSNEEAVKQLKEANQRGLDALQKAGKTNSQFFDNIGREAERIKNRLETFRSGIEVLSDEWTVRVKEDGTCIADWTRRIKAVDPYYLFYWRTGSDFPIERFADIHLSADPPDRLALLPVLDQPDKKAVFAFILPGLKSGDEFTYKLSYTWEKQMAGLAASEHHDEYGLESKFPVAEMVFEFQIDVAIPELKITDSGNIAGIPTQQTSKAGYRIYRRSYRDVKVGDRISFAFGV